jgi:hypothetical protein
MFHNTFDEYWERAEECRLEARRSIHAEDRAAWLSLAEEWLRLAGANAADLTFEAPPLEAEPAREHA